MNGVEYATPRRSWQIHTVVKARYLFGPMIMWAEAMIFGPQTIIQTALMYGFFFGVLDWWEQNRKPPRGTG